MVLETDECIALYAFLKRWEGNLPERLEKILQGCEACVYDTLSVEELERLQANIEKQRNTQ